MYESFISNIERKYLIWSNKHIILRDYTSFIKNLFLYNKVTSFLKLSLSTSMKSNLLCFSEGGAVIKCFVYETVSRFSNQNFITPDLTFSPFCYVFQAHAMNSKWTFLVLQCRNCFPGIEIHVTNNNDKFSIKIYNYFITTLILNLNNVTFSV